MKVLFFQMNTFKYIAILITFIAGLLFSAQSFADCQGCCMYHGGVVCSNGSTICADGSPLSTSCVSKDCDVCSRPPKHPNDIDNDGDGYTENQGDCNDNDKLEFPGQVWYKDFDDDGYSDGSTIVSCSRPLHYRVASELYQTSGDINDLVPDPPLSNAPIMYSISPTTFFPNQTLLIQGKHFGSFQGSAYLSFADQVDTSQVISWSDTQIQCVIPPAVQNGCLLITTNLGKSNCFSYIAKHSLPLSWLLLLMSGK